ncbi:MAG: conserved membrane protein of unknown function [Candidatus Thorarchaeota archaeon]|nr:MAG: conserved membrane protein of unknown function [Candidatus Thorarchaeota archaeon]
MTFLIDPPLLFSFGFISYFIGAKVSDKTNMPIGKILAVFSLFTIIFTSSSLYLNMSYMDWFWIPFQPAVTSGKDLMINSGLFSFESTDTAGLIDALAAIQIALYPLWIYLGVKFYNWKNK